jgi:cobalt/nickel transport system ATP-binding protein
MIRLSKIRFKYNSQPVFDELDFVLNEGDRIGLVGANGTGKTTLCHMIMGLLKPTNGHIEIFGQVRETEADFAKIRGRVGFLFQDSEDQLFCPTVIEDVAFGPMNMGKTPEQAKTIVKTVLQKLQLEGFENRVTYQLSGGEKRLVSLATVLAMDPEILILDEPTGGLDEQTTDILVRVLNDQTDLSYMIVSHDLDFIQRTTSKIYKLEHGKITMIT